MKRPSLAVDGVLLKGDRILLIKRKFDPFRECWALPGGFVEYGETVEQAIAREFAEETNLCVRISSLLNIYSSPLRDPRGHTVSVVFILQAEGDPVAGDDAIDVCFFPLTELPTLAFDHSCIVRDALRKVGR